VSTKPGAGQNDYLHGLWWTKEDGKTYLQTENINEMSFNRKKQVQKAEFESFMRRSTGLSGKINEILMKEYLASEEKKKTDERLAASAQKSP
jgi:hypothetical protein